MAAKKSTDRVCRWGDGQSARIQGKEAVYEVNLLECGMDDHRSRFVWFRAMRELVRNED